MKRVVDLFAGGGGLSIGFEAAGFNVVCAVENWKPAIEVYQANFTDHPILDIDLNNTAVAIKAIQKFNPDMIVGGPPCQDFSSAGKRDESLGRANLTVSFATIISKVKPEYFVMENVARSQGSKAFEEAIAIFEKAGYGLTIKVLDAAYCGVPQQRKRLIVVGCLNASAGFLDIALAEHYASVPMTLRDYFGNSLAIEHYYRHPRSYARRGVFSIDEPSPTIRGVNRPVPKGYPGHAGDTAKLNAKLRPLSTLERARVQTFPANYEFVGCKTDVEQVVGNAVPVNLAKFVARAIATYIASQPAKSPADPHPAPSAAHLVL
jgi:DNA (cytosine-5)-methyltransferase 1